MSNVINEVIVNKAVLKTIEKIPKKERTLIKDFIKNLETVSNPIALPNCKKIMGEDNYYRYRIRSYRILCEIISKHKIKIYVFKVDHRKNIYKNL